MVKNKDLYKIFNYWFSFACHCKYNLISNVILYCNKFLYESYYSNCLLFTGTILSPNIIGEYYSKKLKNFYKI